MLCPNTQSQIKRNPPKSCTSRRKLLYPRPCAGLVQRMRLRKQLDAGVQRTLTLVSAPAGFGKTTLLTASALDQTMPVARFSLDRQDNDLHRFLTYLTQAIEGRYAPQGPNPPADQCSTGTLIINKLAMLTTDVALVLDEYQFIDNPEIHRATDFLLDHQPPRLHLLIASRTDPPLALHLLRARGQLVEIRSPDLQFTRDKTAAFLKQTMGLDLPEESIAALDARAEGWVTGLQFAALVLQDGDSHGTHTAGGLATLSSQNTFYRSKGKGLLDLAEKHRDCFFMIYTNSTLINNSVAECIAKAGNLTPAISLEGWRERTDEFVDFIFNEKKALYGWISNTCRLAVPSRWI